MGVSAMQSECDQSMFQITMAQLHTQSRCHAHKLFMSAISFCFTVTGWLTVVLSIHGHTTGHFTIGYSISHNVLSSDPASVLVKLNNERQ